MPATFLAADVDGVLVGRTSIRHHLDDFLAQEGGHIGYAVLPDHRRRGYATEILRQSLVIARSFGADRVLVTCDDDNVGSATVIERCGGVLESRVTSSRQRRADPSLLDRLMAIVLRRAIVLFVPPPVAARVDEIRRRWDPVMTARIGAHITLVHDVVDHERARRARRRGGPVGAVHRPPDPRRPVGTVEQRDLPPRRRPDRRRRRAAGAAGRAGAAGVVPGRRSGPTSR